VLPGRRPNFNGKWDNLISFGENLKASEAEEQEYKQDREHIETMKKSFKPGPTNDIKSFEKFADEIQRKWKSKDPEHYAKLMLEICGPITSGRFNTDRRFNIARKYALLALSDPNKINLETELELTGHVKTPMFGPYAPKELELADQRKKDVELRLHAWKRLIDAIDPNWDPNEELWSPNAVGADMGLPSGIAPEGVKDPKLRAEYEAALQKNREQIERYTKQYRLRDWLKRFPKRAEEYIIRAYSKPPFNLDELKEYLEKYAVDEKTRARILDAVTKNMQEQAEKIPK
jgi:hypothetical protein